MSTSARDITLDDQSAEEVLVRALEDVLGRDGESIPRLGGAHTTVELSVDGRPSARLQLDRDPCQVTPPGEPAEATIEFSEAQAREFANGHLPTPEAIITGVVQTKGPIRKYLEVDPILRAALRERSGSATTAEFRGPRPSGSPDSTLLAVETRDLHKSFGTSAVLRGLSLKVPEGMISVLLGPSGTGKSVCLSHLIGVTTPDRGDVLIRGRKISEMGRDEVDDLRCTVGVMFQDGALFSSMNVYENVAFPLRQHTDFSDAEIREVVMGHLDRVGLGRAARRMPSELSGGMKKRTGLARALVLDPGIVLVDEPDSGLDPVRTALLGDLLVERHAEQGGTMLVVTHDVALARRMADHISVMWQGTIIESGVTAEIARSDNPFISQFLAGNTAGPLGMDA